jgi:hypothetical protein
LLGPFAASSGTNVDLEFSVDGHNVSVRARVARARRRPDGFLWGLRFDSVHAGQLAQLVADHGRRITWMRQARPFLDRLHPRGSGGPAWSNRSMAIQVDEPREPTVLARGPALPFEPAEVVAPEPETPFAPPPAPRVEARDAVSLFEDEPTRIYYDPLRAASEELDELPSTEPEPDPGTVAFEADILAQLEERDREVNRVVEEPSPRRTVPAFVPPPAPPVRRPVPTLAAPTVSPAELRKLFGEAIADVDRGRRRPRRRRQRS